MHAVLTHWNEHAMKRRFEAMYSKLAKQGCEIVKEVAMLAPSLACCRVSAPGSDPPGAGTRSGGTVRRRRPGC